MKKIVLLTMLLASSAMFAAQLTWTAEGLSSTYSSGTAYLISMTTDTDSSSIASTIQSDGLATYLSSVTVVSTLVSSSLGTYDAWISFDEGVTYYVSQRVLPESLDLTPTYYLIVSSGTDPSAFSVSNGATIATGSVDTLGTLAYTSWTTGTDSTVPEPTCLALLALGVAGLALRRKVA